MTIIMRAARAGDPVSDTILAFIAEQMKKR